MKNSKKILSFFLMLAFASSCALSMRETKTQETRSRVPKGLIVTERDVEKARIILRDSNQNIIRPEKKFSSDVYTYQLLNTQRGIQSLNRTYDFLSKNSQRQAQIERVLKLVIADRIQYESLDRWLSWVTSEKLRDDIVQICAQKKSALYKHVKKHITEGTFGEFLLDIEFYSEVEGAKLFFIVALICLKHGFTQSFNDVQKTGKKVLQNLFKTWANLEGLWMRRPRGGFEKWIYSGLFISTCKYGNFRLVRYIVDTFKTEIYEDVIESALEDAVVNGHSKIVELLINEFKEKISSQTLESNFERAIYNGQLKTGKLFVKELKERNPDDNNIAGQALLNASQEDYWELENVTLLIIEFNNQISDEYAGEAFSEAARWGYIEIVKLLIKHLKNKVSINAKEAIKRTKVVEIKELIREAFPNIALN